MRDGVNADVQQAAVGATECRVSDRAILPRRRNLQTCAARLFKKMQGLRTDQRPL